jgi:hypothetical protein
MWRGEECVLTPVYSGIGHRKIELGFHPVYLLNFHENMMSIKKNIHIRGFERKNRFFQIRQFLLLAFYGHYSNWLDNSISYTYFVPKVV